MFSLDYCGVDSDTGLVRTWIGLRKVEVRSTLLRVMTMIVFVGINFGEFSIKIDYGKKDQGSERHVHSCLLALLDSQL